jgi:hypothetical protein
VWTMARKRRTFEEMADSGFDLRLVPDLELMVLKTHTYVEAMLRRVLADRLGLGDGNECVNSLNYWRLAHLALGNEADRDLLELVESLNRVRNEIAHDLELDAGSKDLEGFVRGVIQPLRADYVWPGPNEAEARRKDFSFAATYVARQLIDRMTIRDWKRAE